MKELYGIAYEHLSKEMMKFGSDDFKVLAQTSKMNHSF